MTRTRISVGIDLEAPGKRAGVLGVPHSDDVHAYGVIPVPIAVVSGAPGPTVLLTAGVHGDEYEGPVALRKLYRSLDPAALRGRVLILPALNLPAVRAARRTSPLDGANMNRVFPGSPDGGPTAQIAHFVEEALLPGCAAAVDLHTGGTMATFVPCAYVYDGGPHDTAKRDLARVFGAPVAIMVGSTAETRSLSSAGERKGVPLISTELYGGGAGLVPDGLALAEAGLARVLAHLGLTDAPVPPPAEPTRFIRVPDRSHFLMCPTDGIVEPCVALGDEVRAGDMAAWIHPVDDPDRPAEPVRFAADGIVLCRRFPALARRGDYLFNTGVPETR